MKKKRELIIVALIVLLIVLMLGQCSWGAKSQYSKEQWKLLEKIANQFRKIKAIVGVPNFFCINFSNEIIGKIERLFGNSDVTIYFNVDIFQNPSETLTKKAGESEDLAILFVSIAENLGFKARVIGGKVLFPFAKEPQRRYWAEIYDQGKWKGIDPSLIILEKNFLIEDVLDDEKYKILEIFSIFNTQSSTGMKPPDIARLEIEEGKEALKKDLVNSFKEINKRQPKEEEIKEMEEIIEHVINQVLLVLQEKIPSDPTTLIRPQNPDVIAFIEKIKKQM